MSRHSLRTTLAVSAAALAGLASLPLYAQYAGPSSHAPAQSVSAILAKPVDDQRVTLQGVLVRQVSSDKYLFSDGSGEIRVEIDHDELPQQRFDQTTRIEIIGEVEKDFLQSPEIDVDHVRVIND